MAQRRSVVAGLVVGAVAALTLSRAGAAPTPGPTAAPPHAPLATPQAARAADHGLPPLAGAVAAAVGPEGAPQLADTAYGALATTLDRIGIRGAHRMGLTGAGIRVGVLDGTFFTAHQSLLQTRVLDTRDFVDGDDDVTPGDDPSTAERGTAVFSLAGASASGFLVGPAFGASYVLARTFAADGAPRADEERWVEGLDWAVSHGARVVLTGAGFRAFDDGVAYEPADLDGATTPTTLAAVEAAGRGVLVVTPVGDLGPGDSTLVAPSDGQDVAAAGAVSPSGLVAAFSSRGPTGDGRDKPDLVLPGVSVPAAGTGSIFQIVERDGTGVSAGLLAGAAALFVEAHPERSPGQAVEALAASALARTDPPSGEPVPDVGSAVAFPDGILSLPLEEVDGSGVVTTLTPLFTWDVPTVFPAALPVTFALRVARDSLFQDLVLTDSVVGAFGRRITQPLPARSTLYWRVDGHTPQEVSRRSPTSGPVAVPPWLSLTTLNDPGGTSISEPRPVFAWEPFEELGPPAGPFLYDLTVFNDRDLTPVAQHQSLSETRFRVPEPLPPNVPLRWQVVARASGAAADTAVSAGPFVVTSTSRPPTTILFQNFPNPFPQDGVDRTSIWFDLAVETSVTLTVFDLRGRRVRGLVPAGGCASVTLPPGPYGRDDGPGADPCVELEWDGRDDQGRAVEPGVYLLRLRTDDADEVRRMVYWP